MKFEKEFSSQMVTECNHYMDYGSLKKYLKPRDANALTRGVAKNHHDGGLNRETTSFNGLQLSIAESRMTAGTIQVKTTADGGCETTFLDEKGGEFYIEFFFSLDKEFNKVSKFYGEKVKEMLEKNKELTKDMAAFIKSSSSEKKSSSSGRKEEMTPLAPGIDSSTDTTSSHTPTGAKSTEVDKEAQILEGESSRPRQLNGAMESSAEVNMSLCMKLKLTFQNWKERKKLKQAYIKFYRELLDLTSYSSSNVEAFSKILKKYDEKTSWNARKRYMEYVDASELKRTDDVVELTKRVEDNFIKHFANAN
ncbi:Phosphate transporter PHO1-like protein 3 [Raphanus sativus]|nr:Phosphate transporter PHO1-like protein 3 [Raphanus sativus]